MLHQVEEIRNLTIRSNWKYCPGILNPADLPSRGITASELVNNNLWWKGPSFLQQSEELWPHQELCKVSDEIKNEMVKNQPHITFAMLTNVFCIRYP